MVGHLLADLARGAVIQGPGRDRPHRLTGQGVRVSLRRNGPAFLPAYRRTPVSRWKTSIAVAIVSFFTLAVSRGTAGEVNLALGKPYALSPAPNYEHCTDAGDATQLTDGQSTREHFWTQKGTVGWSGAPYVTITVDLGHVEPISGVRFTTAAGVAGVTWPSVIRILVSDDGKSYRDVGDLVAMDRRIHGRWPEGYAIRRLESHELTTRGRYVQFLVIPAGRQALYFLR